MGDVMSPFNAALVAYQQGYCDALDEIVRVVEALPFAMFDKHDFHALVGKVRDSSE